VLGARRPLQGVRPHARVRRVYEREGLKSWSPKKTPAAVMWPAFNELLEPPVPWLEQVNRQFDPAFRVGRAFHLGPGLNHYCYALVRQARLDGYSWVWKGGWKGYGPPSSDRTCIRSPVVGVMPLTRPGRSLWMFDRWLTLSQDTIGGTP